MKAFGFHIAVAVLAGLVLPVMARAEDLSRAFVHLGVADVRLDDKGMIYADGTPMVGATYSTNHTTPVVIEGGYFLTPTLAVQASIGSRETSRNTPTGTFAGQPSLGADSFNIATLTLICHPWRGKAVSPYFGLGAGVHLAGDMHDGLVTNFKVRDTSGLALQAGTEVKITRKAGLYLDVKKLFYSARATGDLGPVAVTSSPKLDPVIIQAGITLRL